MGFNKLDEYLNDHKSLKFYKRYDATEVILHVADIFQFRPNFQRE